MTIDLRDRDLTNRDVVFLNHGAWQRPVWNSTACAPARFMPLPSIAYRLARVAVGDGIATVTLRPVNAHDIAAGHALLIAAGGVLVAEDGEPVTYDERRRQPPFRLFRRRARCGGGAARPHVARQQRTSARGRRVTLTWPRVAEGTRLDRALGCMLGQVIGDSLGSQVEFQTAETIRTTYPDGVRDLDDSPVWHTLAGQPTDDSELALTLARSLVRRSGYDPADALAAYRRWYQSGPFDVGTTDGRRASDADGIVPPRCRGSQSNGSLMRIAPIGIWAPRSSDRGRSRQPGFRPLPSPPGLPLGLRRFRRRHCRRPVRGRPRRHAWRRRWSPMRPAEATRSPTRCVRPRGDAAGGLQAPDGLGADRPAATRSSTSPPARRSRPR